ncbi:TMEM175 family protein [Mucilaginibacter sp.]|uniref:TMEM175 family protein n=1 Tax=Mucilaginibacter sp. TaxID=1882438 RepID=UPI0035BBB859
MNTNEREEIKKEFQLERVILFSDAVFAIIITIMVLEIKLPEGLRHASHEHLMEVFIDLLPKIGGYIFAFFITGMFWSKHLKIFSYLKDYTNTLIVLNLLFLFFISLFPFGISVMTETLNPRNYEGFYVYMVIVMLALFSQTLLTGYLVRNAQQLCINPGEIKTNLAWNAQRFNLFAIPVLFVLTFLGYYLKLNSQVLSYCFLAWAAIFGIIRKRLRPDKKAEGPLLARLFKSRKQKAIITVDNPSEQPPIN